MKGFSAEPGERRAALMSTAPARSRERCPALPTWARTSPVRLSMTTIAAEIWGPKRSARSRARLSSEACRRASTASVWAARLRAPARGASAPGGEGEVEVEDLGLGEARLQLPRADELAQLGREAALVARLQQPGHLHGEGGAAGDDAAAQQSLAGGAQEGRRVDA